VRVTVRSPAVVVLFLLLTPCVEAQFIPTSFSWSRIVQGGSEAAGAAGWIRENVDRFDDVRDMVESHQTLNPDDDAFDPDYSPPGSPQLPTRCLDEDDLECLQCYQSAQNELNFLRQTLERLRSIYGATKNYTERAISFGDSMAGLPGGFGIGWPPERRGIEQEFEKLGKTYDKKYRELIGNLEKALREIAECEKQHFNTDDWYNRYGFIYYTFMADRYRRE